MPRKRFSPEQIVTLLRQIEVATAQGKSISIACREAGISDQSYFRWRKEYGGLDLDQAKKMKALERENAHLKRLVADLSLEKQVLKDIVSPERRRQAVVGAREKYQLSERHACRLVGQPRGTQRYSVIVRADEDALTHAIIGLASAYGRYGYRRITSLLNSGSGAVRGSRFPGNRSREAVSG